MTGVGTPGSRKDDFEGPDDGVVLPDQVLTLSLAVTVERIDGGKLQRDLGRCRSGPSPTGGVGPPPDFGEDDSTAPPDEGGRHPPI
jgi:hypothetical protein